MPSAATSCGCEAFQRLFLIPVRYQPIAAKALDGFCSTLEHDPKRELRSPGLHRRGHPIPGIYVAGNAAAPDEIGVGYQAGTSLSSAMTYGHLAVRHMLAARDNSASRK